MIDLHVHTTASDGRLSPREVVRLARQKGIRALAITDHDTVAGVKEAYEQGRALGVEIVPGVELSAKTATGMLHILGYYVHIEYPRFQECLEALRNDRHDLFLELLAKLRESRAEQSFEPLSQNECCVVSASPSEITGSCSLRPDPRCEEMSESLVLPVKRYWPRANLTLDQAVQLIVAVGGVPVLAHPYSLIKYSNEDWSAVLARLITHGVQGIEVYYPEHTPAQTSLFRMSAEEFGLVATGGSDFHGRIHRINGRIHPIEALGEVPGWTLPYSLLNALRRRVKANRRAGH